VANGQVRLREDSSDVVVGCLTICPGSGSAGSGQLVESSPVALQEVVQSPGVVRGKYSLSGLTNDVEDLDNECVVEHEDVEEDGEDEQEARDLSNSFISPTPTRQGGRFLSSLKRNFQSRRCSARCPPQTFRRLRSPRSRILRNGGRWDDTCPS
jgi:hypothetical protein